MEWAKHISTDILRFKYDKDQSDKLDGVLEEFRGNKTVYWHEQDGPIEVCVYTKLLETYEQREPVVVQVYEWDRGKDDEGFEVPIPLKYDFFLGLVNHSKYVTGASEENVLKLINKKKRLKIKRKYKILWKESLETALKRAIETLQKEAR